MREQLLTTKKIFQLMNLHLVESLCIVYILMSSEYLESNVDSLLFITETLHFYITMVA